MPLSALVQLPVRGDSSQEWILGIEGGFLVLVALQTAHLTRVHLGCVHVFVDHELVLADAGKGETKAVVRAGKREASG